MSRRVIVLVCILFVWCLAACRPQPAAESGTGFGYGRTVFIAHENQVQMYDVATPENPQLITTWETPGRVRRIVTDGQRAYVIHWPSEESWDSATGPRDGGVQLVNIRQPQRPQIEGYFTTRHLAEDLTVQGDLVYVSDWENVYAVEWPTPNAPREVTSLPQGLGAVAVEDNLLLGVWGSCSFRSGACAGGLWLADIGEPQAPLFLGQFTPELRPGYDVALLKTDTHRYALVAGHGLWVVDITDPAAPQEVAYQETTDGFHHARLVVKGHTAVMVSDAHIRVYDVSQPGNPLLVGQMDWHSPPLDMMWASDGDYLYVSTWDGLAIVDVSDRQRPFLVTTTAHTPIPPPQPTVTPAVTPTVTP
ncbi:MAG: hypothetical protein KF770_24300 [Anaerolineae bacterium]|nr:hypothetical protein [Anaerolineae bacterium]